MTDRAAHLAWAKARAVEYLDAGRRDAAVSSMLSDLAKHADTATLIGTAARAGLGILARGNDVEALRRWLDGIE